MWQRFTEKSRLVVFRAQEEALRLNDVYINTEHLLFALLRDEENVACRILKRMDIAPQTIHAALERKISVSNAAPHRVDSGYQLTPQAKRVFDLAYDEARQLSNNYIGTEHLLLALIRKTAGLAGRVLMKQGVTLERTRREVMALQDHDAKQPIPGDASPTPNPAPSLRSSLPSASRHTSQAAEILFDWEFRKLSPEQQQALQTDGLPISQLPPVFRIIMKVATETWNTQADVISGLNEKLRVQQAQNGNKWVYNVQTEVTLIATLLATDE